MNVKVFLSASIPLPPPYRHEKYYETGDQIAIRDSIRALVTALMPTGALVFGGHPAITPMIGLMLQDKGLPVAKHIQLFQSRFFENVFSAEVRNFEGLVVVDHVPGNRDESLILMRQSMIGSADFAAGVFIGGMEGVEEEYYLFREQHPDKPVFPIASTGAAARILFERHSQDQPELLDELRYLSLFRRLLSLDEGSSGKKGQS
jgi:hypothetical protein